MSLLFLAGRVVVRGNARFRSFWRLRSFAGLSTVTAMVEDRLDVIFDAVRSMTTRSIQ
jgi:hypothetical protein